MSSASVEVNWAEVDALVEAAKDKRQPGEFTMQEYADHAKISRTSARARLAKLVEQGVIEKRMVNQSMTFYRVKAKGE